MKSTRIDYDTVREMLRTARRTGCCDLSEKTSSAWRHCFANARFERDSLGRRRRPGHFLEQEKHPADQAIQRDDQK
jgi:hypothetical protein